MQRIAILILAAVVTVCSAHAQADADLAVLTPEAAVELAVANNKGLARDRIDLEAAQRALGRSWNGALPGMTASAGTTHVNATDTDSSYASIAASVTASASIVTAVEKARISYETETLAYNTSVRDLELNVRKSFYSLILKEENLTVLKQSLATAQKTYEQTEAKRRAGLATELDALSAQVSLENLKPELESAQLSYEKALATFKQLLGLDQSKEIDLKGSLDDTAKISKIDFSGLSGESPSVAEARKTVESARISLKAARFTIYSPSLTLSAAYKPTKSGASSDWSDSGTLSAIFSFSLDNLLPWSSARETADKAGDTLVKAESTLEEAVTTADIDLKSLERSIDQSLTTLKALRLTVTLAERTYTLTEEAYRYGTKDRLSLQDAADSLQEARVNLLEEAYTLISNILDLEYALGVPFGTLGH